MADMDPEIVAKWNVVVELANQAGISGWNLKKWRHRGIPPKWRIHLVEAAGGQLSFNDFVRMETDLVPRRKPRKPRDEIVIGWEEWIQTPD